jgi:hypothetical protein
MVVLIQPFSYHLVGRKEEEKKRRKKGLNSHGGRGGGDDDDAYMTTACMYPSIYLHPHSQPSDKASSSYSSTNVINKKETAQQPSMYSSPELQIILSTSTRVSLLHQK